MSIELGATPESQQTGAGTAGQQAQRASFAGGQPSHQQQRPMNQQQSTNQIVGAMRSMNPSVLSADPDAKPMRVFNERLKELEPDLNGVYTVKAIPVSSRSQNNGANLACSAIILAVQRDGHKDRLAYHTLLLGDTTRFPGGRVPSLNRNFNGTNVEILRTIGDVYDDIYRQAVANVLTAAYPSVKPDMMFDADAELLPNGYDYENVNLVRSTVANALSAASTMLNATLDNFQHFSLTQDHRNFATTATLMVNQPQTYNTAGEVVRSDVVLEVAAYQPQRDANQIVSLNSADTPDVLFRISGFMDLLWNPNTQVVAQQNSFFQPQQQQQQLPLLYSARYVITQLDAPELKTLPQVLFGLSTLVTLQAGHNWMGAFWNASRQANDPHDIGGIGIEATQVTQQPGSPEYGQPFDTRKDNFTPNDLGAMIRTFIRPELVISMDVPEVGPNTWLTSVFASSAAGVAAATDEIEAAADVLTMGAFGRRWTKGQPILVNDNTRIHLGHYQNANSEKRDLRDIDYLTVLNRRGRTNPDLPRDWSDTFARQDFVAEQRLAGRYAIIQHIAGAEVHVTGFARRVTFTGKFLETLAQAISECGVKVLPQTPFSQLGGQPRAVADFLASAGMTGNLGGGYLGGSFGGVSNNGGYGISGGVGRYAAR